MEKKVEQTLNARLIYVRLTGLNIASKNLTPSNTQVAREDRARILELTKDHVVISYSAKLVFRPEGPFDINIDYNLLYRLPEESDEERIRANFSDLLYPAITRTCLLIAFLTEETGLIQPLITPPVFNEEAAALLK